MVASEVNAVMNEGRRVGGLSPAQLVLRRTPRYGVGEQHNDELRGLMGSLQDRTDPTTIFAVREMIRHEAKEFFFRTQRFVGAGSNGTVTPSRLAISWSCGSSISTGSEVSITRAGRSGEPSGLYAVTRMECASQNSSRRGSARYG